LFPELSKQCSNAYASLGQEQAMLIAQGDRLAGRAVLIFFEFKLAQIAVGLLAFGGLDSGEILSEPEGAVPGSRARNA
jgi:hypothetical protein